MTIVAKQFVILLTSLSLIGIDSIKADPVPKRLKITLPNSLDLGGKPHKVAKIDEQQFVDLFASIVEAFNADSKQFGVDAAITLTEIFGLENNPNAKGVFAISPMFNRDMLVATLMVGNKIKLDDDDFDRLKKTFAAFGKKTDNKEERMLVAIIYGSLLAEWKHP